MYGCTAAFHHHIQFIILFLDAACPVGFFGLQKELFLKSRNCAFHIFCLKPQGYANAFYARLAADASSLLVQRSAQKNAKSKEYQKREENEHSDNISRKPLAFGMTACPAEDRSDDALKRSNEISFLALIFFIGFCNLEICSPRITLLSAIGI